MLMEIYLKFRGSKPYRLAGLILLTLISTGCLKKNPYRETQLESFRQRPENIQLRFRTGKGTQVAFYLPPLKNPEKPPGKIAILYPGIETVALDWLRFIRFEDDPETGYLLIDYPGRGLCEGLMRPEKNYKNSEGAIAALARYFEVDKIDVEISLMGHSFGTGAALQFARYKGVKRIVLVAPFNALTQAVAQKSNMLAFLMPSRIDNRKQIKSLLSGSSPPEITIIHGRQDASLPVAMGRELAAIDPARIIFHELPEADHVSVLSSHRDLIFHTLLGTAD